MFVKKEIGRKEGFWGREGEITKVYERKTIEKNFNVKHKKNKKKLLLHI